MPTIHVDPTPNPNSLKFTLEEGHFIESGMESFRSAEEAASHPLASKLFALPGVDNVFIMPQFLTVTKKPEADWDNLLPRIQEILQEYIH